MSVRRLPYGVRTAPSETETPWPTDGTRSPAPIRLPLTVVWMMQSEIVFLERGYFSQFIVSALFSPQLLRDFVFMAGVLWVPSRRASRIGSTRKVSGHLRKRASPAGTGAGTRVHVRASPAVATGAWPPAASRATSRNRCLAPTRTQRRKGANGSRRMRSGSLTRARTRALGPHHPKALPNANALWSATRMGMQ